MTLNVNAMYLQWHQKKFPRLRVFYFKVNIFHCALLANLSPNCQENYQNQHAITLAMNELLCLKNVGAQIVLHREGRTFHIITSQKPKPLLFTTNTGGAKSYISCPLSTILSGAHIPHARRSIRERTCITLVVKYYCYLLFQTCRWSLLLPLFMCKSQKKGPTFIQYYVH